VPRAAHRLPLLAQRADVQFDPQRLVLAEGVERILDIVDIVIPDPVEHEPVRRQESELLSVFHCVQRSDPGIELLLGQLVFEMRQTLLPE
jgi:hypothetical protein